MDASTPLPIGAARPGSHRPDANFVRLCDNLPDAAFRMEACHVRPFRPLNPLSRIAARYFDLQLPVGDVHAKYNITPGTQITSVLATPDEPVSFDFSHWGFHPPWAKEDAPTPINIRA